MIIKTNKAMKNIHVLKTDKPSRLIHNDANQLCYQSNKSFKNDRKWMYRKKFNIYITSDEEIKEGDWFLHPFNTLHKAGGNLIDKDFRKIILTTDQDLIQDGVQSIPDEFLEWFIQNPSCEEVEVEDYNSYGVDNWKYLITIPKEETKLKNICIKCGVDLYATEGRFECQKHPKECKGIILPKETLQEWADKEKQKQHLIDIMKADEELGLYEEPKQHYEDVHEDNVEKWRNKQECMITKIMQMDAKMAYDSLPKQETTLEEAAENSFLVNKLENSTAVEKAHYIAGFRECAKWQQERMYSEEEVKQAYIDGSNNPIEEDDCYGTEFFKYMDDWFEQFKKK